MKLEPLYRATFTTPESWTVEVGGDYGSEWLSFLIAEGRTEGRLSARYRGANMPRGTACSSWRRTAPRDGSLGPSPT